MKSYGVTIQVKATEKYFPVVLLIILHKVVLTIFRWYCLSLHTSQGCFFFKFVDETLRITESFKWKLQLAILSCGTVNLLDMFELAIIVEIAEQNL